MSPKSKTATADTRRTWWFWRHVQERLTTFALALVSPLKGKRYRILLKATGTGYHDPVSRVIQANPQMFPDQLPAVQFRCTQGVLAHEAGHALFTESWPEAKENVLCQLVNMLEDERIENCISAFYPGIAPAIRLLGDLMLASQPKLAGFRAEDQALALCLVWRWAHRRESRAHLLKRLGISPDGTALWAKVRPLVEESWAALDTRALIEIARRILDLLGLPASRPALEWLSPFVSTDGVPSARDGEALPPPAGPCGEQQPGLGLADGEPESLPEDDYLHPAPYTELENEAWPLARQIAEALRLPEPDVHPLPHEWRGRYSFRQEVRTPDSPCLYAEGIERVARSIALCVLVDRSGSMRRLDEHVRLALMMLYLAAGELAIPVGLAAFGGNYDGDESRLVFPIAEMSTVAGEAPKSLIAGYTGATSREFLDWGLRLAERELALRAERLKFLVVIHDGQPVYDGPRGNDWALSLAHLRRLEAAGITPIGLYLGEESEDERKLRQLFRWLIVATGEKLAGRLGDLLRALASA